MFNLKFFKENISIPYEVFILDNSPESMDFDFAENENYIFLAENIGTSSRNFGIQKANSPICLLLDDDSHPFPGSVEKLINDFKHLPNNCAGLISEIHNPDGNREATLLPTVFHGAGVAFKTQVLKEHNILYPENYCFYGEEYRMTLEIYKAGFRLESSSNFKVMHRRSNKGRDLKKIFYYLGRNNKAIWNDIVPEKYLDNIIYDSQRRYELTAQKEEVSKDFQKGLNEETVNTDLNPMSVSQFEQYSLIDKVKTLPDNETYILCGTGKFPSLFGNILSEKKCRVNISDFNSGLIGNDFKSYTVIHPNKAIQMSGNFILGHSSKLDSLKWRKFLEENNKDYIDLDSKYELNAI